MKEGYQSYKLNKTKIRINAASRDEVISDCSRRLLTWVFSLQGPTTQTWKESVVWVMQEERGANEVLTATSLDPQTLFW